MCDPHEKLLLAMAKHIERLERTVDKSVRRINLLLSERKQNMATIDDLRNRLTTVETDLAKVVNNPPAALDLSPEVARLDAIDATIKSLPQSTPAPVVDPNAPVDPNVPASA